MEPIVSRREIALPDVASVRGGDAGPIPSVVIVGRPNVGKSSLLNCLARQRIAIVDPTAGVTRDRISAIVEHEGRMFELWDTGGIGTTDDLAAEVQTQIEIALARADLVLFVVDAQEGLVPFDRDIALRLRTIDRAVLMVANKVDHASHEQGLGEFHTLGFGDPAAICALHGYGRSDLLDKVVPLLPETHSIQTEPLLKLAVVGRQNVGKSTLINTLAREERVIVSELPGTTRDAVDVRFEREGRTFMAVDTAGLKRKSRLADSVEFYSLMRAYRAIRRCDVVIFMIDIAAEISRVDKQLAAAIERNVSPCVIAVNKWDLAESKFTTDQYTRYLNDRLTGLAFAPISFICATDGRNIDDTLTLAETLFETSRHQAPTAQLNEMIHDAVRANPPHVRHGKRPKLFYATQIGTAPPVILIFAAHPHLIDQQYTRYLANFLRKHPPFSEIPLRIVFRSRPRREANDAGPPPETKRRRRHK